MDENNNKYPYDDNQNQGDETNDIQQNGNINQQPDNQASENENPYPQNEFDQTFDSKTSNQPDNSMYQANPEKETNSSGLGASPKSKKTKSKKPTRTQRARGGGFFSGIIGGVISAALIIGLLISGVIPTDSFSNDSSDSVEQSHTGNQSGDQDSDDSAETVSVSDDSDEASDIDEASEAVVGVKNMQQEDIWDEGEEAGTASGIIYKKDGDKAYVVTNNHVVQDAGSVEVVLDDDEQVDAKVLGKDELTDLAVLEIDSDHVDVVANLGSSDDLSVGETVMAIGNPLGDQFYGSVTKGIISGKDRSVEMDTTGNQQPDYTTEVLQTDTAINPGNSGGALVNTDGEVVGINSMKVAQQQVEGMGFAIPIDSAVPIIKQLESDGEISRPFLGVSTAPMEQVPMQYQEKIDVPDDVDGGMVVADIESGSPAEDADLQQFDLITQIDGEDVKSTSDLRNYLYDETEIGDKVTVTYYRDGEKQEADLKLEEREDD